MALFPPRDDVIETLGVGQPYLEIQLCLLQGPKEAQWIKSASSQSQAPVFVSRGQDHVSPFPPGLTQQTLLLETGFSGKQREHNSILYDLMEKL
jgi:hypothetical protein